MGKVEIKKSLKTSDYREAQLRGRIERVKIDAEWETLRRQLSPAVVSELSEREAWQLAARWFVDFEKRNAEKSDRWTSLEDAERELAALSTPENIATASYQEAEHMLAKDGLRLVPGSHSWTRLNGFIRDGLIEAARRDIARSFPLVALPTDPQFAGLTASTKLQPVAKITVKKLIAHVRSDTTRSPMSKKTTLKRTAQWQAITEFFGADTDVAQIGRPRIREFIDLLQKLPSNATKHFPDATIFEAVQLAADKKLPVLATETANDYLRTLGSLFRAAVREEWLTKDPSDGLLIQAKTKVAAKDKRLPFSYDDLKAIFSAPLYTGCKDDEAGYNVEGTKIVRRGRFWAPLMALYTGMRLNEVPIDAR
ncbi:hypothetical protein AU467_23530 [Mesorhizobium loti]|uniref:DUF6538 domain-containing protein n=1 Tax=Rhizobium loti TaxID=381 RepID=A0A101KS97_RHILI|nr:hypothetical protein AU467_23530 [Mesorhizobium loti]